MSSSAETSTSEEPSLRLAGFDSYPLVRKIPGRNRTKAEVRVYRTPDGDVALKDYSSCPWPIRNLLGRTLIRREARAYAAVAGLPGIPRCLGRTGPFTLALQWIDATPLARHAESSVDPDVFDKLELVLAGLHDRGVALVDVNYRDLLVARDGSAHVVDLAMTLVLGNHPGRIRRRIFEHFRAADRFALARLRARFVGEDPGQAVADADPRVLAWHRRGRRLKWRWDRLRGATRRPPVDDHWKW